MRPQPTFIDSHCHIDFSCFDHDRRQVLKRCVELGIHTIVMPGTQENRWHQQLKLAKQHPQLKVALGLHPYFLQQYQEQHLDILRKLLTEHRQQVVALGEIGLDKAIDINWQLQTQVFVKQLELAQANALPIILHHRKSHNEIIKLLKDHQFENGGIVHAFSGSLEVANTYIDMGFKLGIGGGITYPRANKTRQTISQIPLSSLVLETDAPDMPINGKQGQRNSPEYLIEIFKVLMALRQEAADTVMQALLKNTENGLTNLNTR